MALVNVSKGSKELGRPLCISSSIAGQHQLLPSFPTSKWMLLIRKEPKSQQMEIIGMERKWGVLGVFCLEAWLGVSFASCTVL